ncbi:MAG: hypothetical protein JWP04_3628, partial [Belnapia sp.]|nr:hypothetical protein [Belnapia sp.]
MDGDVAAHARAANLGEAQSLEEAVALEEAVSLRETVSLGEARSGFLPEGLRQRGGRRRMLGWLGGAGVTGAGFGGYALGWEPGVRLRLVRHRLAPAAWPRDLPLTIAIIADPHAGGPHTTPERLARAVAMTNAARPDVVVLMGDYLADHRFITTRPTMREVADVLAGLRAPLGVHAVLGNHDWWEDAAAQSGERALPEAAEAFAAAGLPIMHNEARPLLHRGRPVWLAGLGSQWAYRRRRREIYGADDLAGTLAAIPEGAPTILLAHEPDIFPEVPDRVAVTISGHTHGGQVRVFGYS